jgi:hypothetical protein
VVRRYAQDEISMDGKRALDESWVLEWKLMAEFETTSDAAGEQFLADQVGGAGQRLFIQPSQVADILDVMKRALIRVTHNPGTAIHSLAVRIRIWASIPYAERSGWGFFLVDKHGNDHLPDGVPNGHLLELFLYRVQRL